MTAAAVQRRTCRTCPAVISEHGETGQCRPCQQRSGAIRAVVAPEPTPTRTKTAAPRARTCEQGGHHGCRHFAAIFKSLKGFMEDSDFCWVCNAEAEGDDLTHQEGCAYHAIEIAAREAGVPW